MNFIKAISDLLFKHECVVVPGFGGFLVKQQNAHYNAELNRFYPPAGTVYFNADLKATDGLIANYLANRHGVTYREASDAIDSWTEEIRSIIKAKGYFVMPGIGSFSSNQENNLEFSPDEKANFLASSFGLPVFTPHQVVFNEAGNNLVRIRKERNTANVVGETLKWAAALLPFALIATWSVLNINTIGNIVRSEAALFPWTFSTPGKSVQITTPARQKTNVGATEQLQSNICNYVSQAEVTAYSGYKVMHELSPAKQVSKPAYLGGDGYYIIGGAFKSYGNALRYTEQMKSRGYSSGMLGMNEKGLYVVFIQSCSTQSDALVQLSNIRRSVQPEAWLFRN